MLLSLNATGDGGRYMKKIKLAIVALMLLAIAVLVSSPALL